MNNMIKTEMSKVVCMPREEYTGLIRKLSSYRMLLDLIKNGLLGVSALSSIDIDDHDAYHSLEDVEVSDADAVPAEILEQAQASYLSSRSDESVDSDDFLRQVAVQDIRARREEMGLSQSELADLAGVNQAQLSRLENSPQCASGNVLRKLASALKMPIVIPPDVDAK